MEIFATLPPDILRRITLLHRVQRKMKAREARRVRRQTLSEKIYKQAMNHFGTMGYVTLDEWKNIIREGRVVYTAYRISVRAPYWWASRNFSRYGENALYYGSHLIIS